MGLIKKLRKAKKEAPPNEKPAVVKTHLRDMVIVPEMIGSVVGIYNGKVCLDSLGRWVSRRDVLSQVFNSVEIKPEMTGHYLAEFSCSYRPVKHGRPGVCFFNDAACFVLNGFTLRSVLHTHLDSYLSSRSLVFTRHSCTAFATLKLYATCMSPPSPRLAFHSFKMSTFECTGIMSILRR